MDEMGARRNKIRLVSSTPDASALLIQVARGDRSAFSDFYDLVIDRVYGIARKVIRDPEMAEEVTQEVMVEVWRKASSFDSTKGSATAWVCTIAHRRAVDRVRSEQSRRNREANSFVHDADDAAVDEAVIEAEEQSQVGSAMSALTFEQREALNLAFYDGRTHTEVAEILEIPLGTAKTRIRDGLIKLRDAVTTECGR